MDKKTRRALVRFVQHHSPVKDEMTLMCLIGDKWLFKPPFRPGDEPNWLDVVSYFLVENRHLSVERIVEQLKGR